MSLNCLLSRTNSPIPQRYSDIKQKDAQSPNIGEGGNCKCSSLLLNLVQIVNDRKLANNIYLSFHILPTRLWFGNVGSTSVDCKPFTDILIRLCVPSHVVRLHLGTMVL